MVALAIDPRNLFTRENLMLRRVVIDNRQLEIVREANARSTRTLRSGNVINILQMVRPGIARFTIEGEGADVWFCDQSTMEADTLQASAAGES
jgi:hypothetical protein